MQRSLRVRGRRRSTPAQRERILVAYRRSRLTQKAFAAQAGIGYSTLTLWLRKAQSAQNASRTGHSSALVRVPNLFSASAAAPAYRLKFPGGLTVEVAAGFRATELERLLQVVQSL